MKKIELLAPAGNMKCLKAAISAGCDAVYLSGKLFGARAFAGNFTNEEIVDAINYAHLYGVKVYITINTIIYEDEVDKFIDYVRFIHKNNVDAVLIQDLGMFDLIKKKFPNLEIHASTQMHIHNYEGACFANKYGFKRVVMARETSIDVIKKIKKELDIEVEAFVHGALCVSYSGECLLSALIGNRSANRGSCAGICRKKYNLYDINFNKLNTDNYLLSMKDLNTIDKIDKLIDSGIDSLKIEGRMKREEYVYLVVKMYRNAIDNYYKYKKVIVDKNDDESLKKIFNRTYTKGFIFNENNNNITNELRPNHVGVKIGVVTSKIKDKLTIKLTHELNINDGIRILDDKEDKGLVINKMYVNNKLVKKAFKGDEITIYYDKFVKKNSDVLLTTDYNEIKEIDRLINNNERKVLIDVLVVAKANEKLYIKVNDGKNIIEDYGSMVEYANKVPITKDDIKNRVCKTGNTVYKVNNIDINMDDNIFINIRDLNELRRNVLNKLDKKRLYDIPFVEKDYTINLPDFKKERKKSVLVDNEIDYLKYKDKYDLVYVTDKKITDDKTVYKIPRVIKNYENYDKKVLIGEVGSLIKYNKFDTDFSFNVVNSYTVAFLHSIGANKVTLSYELNYTQTKKLIDAYEKRYEKHPNLEVIVNSYPEAMICKYDINKKYKVSKSYLEDEFHNKYKIVSKDDYMILYNFEKKIIENEDDYYKIGINYLRTNM